MKAMINLGIALFTILWWMSSCNSQPDAPGEERFHLTDSMWAMTELSPVEWKPAEQQFQFFGKVTAAQGKTAPVYTMTGGKVRTLFVEQGDYVRKGQVLAQIHSIQVAEFERRRIELENAVRESKRKLDVIEDMHESHLASSRDLLAAKHERENAEASLREIQEVFGVYDQAQNGLYQVLSPINGYVLETYIAAGMQLPEDHRDPLFVVAEMDPVWVLAQVTESDLGKVEEGLEANIKTLTHPDKVFQGKVDRIYQVIDAATRSATMRIPLENSDLLLKPNMSVRVTVVKRQEDSLATLPKKAMIFDRNRHWVVVSRGRDDMEIRQVKQVSESQTHVQVAELFSSGESVVSKNQLLIYDVLSTLP